MLNSQQKDAVRYAQGPLLVLAGAGCGKTKVITEKIIYLLKQHNIQASLIYAITFTNKAAREMRERLNKLSQQAQEVNVSTFHALGLQILQTEIKNTPYHYGFSILDGSETHKILKELMPAGIKKEAISQMQWQISEWKNAGQFAQDIEVTSPLAREAYEKYQAYLQAINAVDFDDMILQPLQLLKNNVEARLRWQNKVGYLLVDEYQDTNASQYQLLKLLVGQSGRLTCVGDDDQSIYGWRGAQPENLQLLNADFPSLQVITLEQNYRSSKTILAAAHGLIAHNPHPFEKRIWSDLGVGDAVQLNHFETAEQEAMQVSADIEYKRVLHQLNYDEFAVLYRSNHQARVFEQVLRSHNIPYHISGGRSFFDYTEIRDLMAYLRLLVNPKDNTAVLRIINTPKRGIGAQTVKQISQLAKQYKLSLLQACNQSVILSQLNASARVKVAAFFDLINKHQHSNAAPAATIKSLIKQIDYLSWVRTTTDQVHQKNGKAKLVTDFIKWIDALSEGKAKTMDEVLNVLSLQNSQDEEQTQDRVVRLMTLHSAKGLEFPHVYLVGLEEGILPHRNSLSDENNEGNNTQVQEERRLLYVGMTRAMRKLNLSYVLKRQQRFQTDEKIINGPSRFIEEIPDKFLTGNGIKAVETVSTEKSAKQHLAALRAMLEDSQ